MSTKFEVMGREHVTLGTITVPNTGTGEDIWPQAIKLAAQQYHTDPCLVAVSSVVVSSGEHISKASASNMPVPELAAQRGMVLVEPPLGSQPVWQERIARSDQQLTQLQSNYTQLRSNHTQLQGSHNQLQTEVKELKTSNSQLQASISQLQAEVKELKTSNIQLLTGHEDLKACVDKLSKRTNRIALRALMDAARTKLNHNQELSNDDKQVWNQRIQNIAQLNVGELTWDQVQLTRYGQFTAQGQGAAAAHVVPLEDVAEAVTSCVTHKQGYYSLFKFVHGISPDDVVMDDF